MIEKMEELLDDQTTYKRTTPKMYRGRPVDLESTLQNKINKYITNLENAGSIDSCAARRLRCYNGVVPRIYGLYKIHKDGVPLRPINSCIGSPNYNLSKFFANILSNVRGGCSLKNSESFKEKCGAFRVSVGHKLFSLDFVSLYTNISKSMAIVAITEYWNEIRSHTYLTLQQFIEGIELLFDTCLLTFKNVTYQQTHGLPMGLSISAAVAELVLRMLEGKALETLSTEGIVVDFYERYVDDSIISINPFDLDRVVAIFNSFDNRLQVTSEEEENGCIGFLDIAVHRNTDGSLLTDWYQKKTWSGRYLNFKSYLPYAYKKNTPAILAQKILKLSDPVFHGKNFDLLMDTLRKNGYPSALVHDCIAREIDKYTGNVQPIIARNPPKKTIALPYNVVPFNKIRKILEEHDIRVVGRASTSIGHMFYTSLKDKVPTRLKSGVVYQVSCECGETYVGQTDQYVEKRFKQHVNTNGEAGSALSAHLRESSCNVTFDDLKILCCEKHLGARLTKEAVYIMKYGTLNFQEDSERLPPAYHNVI